MEEKKKKKKSIAFFLLSFANSISFPILSDVGIQKRRDRCWWGGSCVLWFDAKLYTSRVWFLEKCVALLCCNLNCFEDSSLYGEAIFGRIKIMLLKNRWRWLAFFRNSQQWITNYWALTQLLKKIWINLELYLVKLDDNTQCGHKYAMLCMCWSVWECKWVKGGQWWW